MINLFMVRALKIHSCKNVDILYSTYTVSEGICLYIFVSFNDFFDLAK